VKLAVEGPEDFVRELKQRVQEMEACESATLVDAVSDHELDTAELAYERLAAERDMSQVNVNEVADAAGLPADKTDVALEKLGLKDSLWSA